MDRILNGIETGQFGGVIVKDLSRLSRLSLSDALALIERIESAGATVISIDENFDASTPAGEKARSDFLSLHRMMRRIYGSGIARGEGEGGEARDVAAARGPGRLRQGGGSEAEARTRCGEGRPRLRAPGGVLPGRRSGSSSSAGRAGQVVSSRTASTSGRSTMGSSPTPRRTNRWSVGSCSSRPSSATPLPSGLGEGSTCWRESCGVLHAGDF